ncbi:MAG: hypothetical protein IJ438_10465 [Clostridia bacterium]|nr:hypothetical protein [Clostridia bacterium]
MNFEALYTLDESCKEESYWVPNAPLDMYSASLYRHDAMFGLLISGIISRSEYEQYHHLIN